MSRSVNFKSDVLGTISLCKGDMMKTVYEYLSVEAARTDEMHTQECLNLELSVAPVGRGVREGGSNRFTTSG